MTEDTTNNDLDISDWEIPTTPYIPVLLAGLQDADWELEPDERDI
jgi:hypothetical protein